MSFFEAVKADDITLHGLEKWTCHMYEQLGWMTLANKSGNMDKVSAYIISIKKLKNSIESRLKIITSEDAKLDLENLLSNVKHLITIASKLFNEEHIKNTICDKCNIEPKQNDITIKSKNNTNLNGGSKTTIQKSDHLKKLTKLAKKTSKKSSKKLFKKSSKKLSKKLSKKTSKKISK